MSKYVQNDTEKMLSDFYGRLKKPLPWILKQVARTEAVSFARSTQPYTQGDNWEASKQQGEAAVERDIHKLYATPGQVYVAMKRRDEGLADAFWYFFQTGKIGGKRGAQALVDASKTRFAGLRIETFNPVFHQQNRGKGGKVRAGVKQIVRNVAPLEKYVESKQKLVGFVKGAWATCARMLRGVRGIPGWVTRQRSPGSVEDKTMDPDRPYVLMRNEVDYASQALPAGAEAEALRSAHDRLELMVRKAVDAAAKKKELNESET